VPLVRVQVAYVRGFALPALRTAVGARVVRTHECCGKRITGKPIVMISYWCDKCQTEHLHDAVEMTEYVQRVHREANNGMAQRLPNIL
jgi:hypothetical protein